MKIEKDNYMIVLIEAPIGAGKTTLTEYLETLDEEKLELLTHEKNKENYKRINVFKFKEETANSPFLGDFYEHINNRKNLSRKDFSIITARLEHAFFVRMIENFRTVINKINASNDENFNIFIFDRNPLSVKFFIDFYYVQGYFRYKEFKHLKKMVKDFKELIDLIINNERTLPIYIETTISKGWENVVKRSRDAESTMSKEYYKILFDYYEKRHHTIFNKRKDIKKVLNTGDYPDNMFKEAVKLIYDFK